MFFKKKKKIFLCVAVIMATTLIFFFFLYERQVEDIHYLSSDVDTSEDISYLKGHNLSFEELSKYFQNLAKTKGAAYAFQILRVASLPPDTDLHLLGHAVGDILYKQKGINGIQICTNEFRNACSHSIVIGLLLDKGEQALGDISNACRQAPGGSGAYTMCYHGLGHGILAYADYDLARAAALCKKTGVSGEAPQCIGGAIMEIISGGGHNHALWEKKRIEWLKPKDPLYPCTRDFMPPDGKIFCLIYITPYLWEAVGADIGHPGDKDFAASFKFCDALSADDAVGRDACFGGFGKEFTTLANDRDIRNVDQMDDEHMRKVYNWCTLAGNQNGIAACVTHAMNSLYWGGENKPEGAIRFCGVITPDYQQRSCFMGLIQSVRTYQNDPNYRSVFCKDLPLSYQDICGDYLLR